MQLLRDELTRTACLVESSDAQSLRNPTVAQRTRSDGAPGSTPARPGYYDNNLSGNQAAIAAVADRTDSEGFLPEFLREWLLRPSNCRRYFFLVSSNSASASLYFFSRFCFNSRRNPHCAP